jgi:drug/metabolite transporter (DMT)-like permease
VINSIEEHLMTNRAATLLGLIAILLWATLAPLTVLAAGLPPLQLVGMSFTLGSLIGVAFLIASADARRNLRRVTLPAIALGVGGLLGFHFFYFLSLSLAPPLEANLVNYLWPLLIVLFSALLPRADRLRPHHWAGAMIAFAGAALAITKGERLPEITPEALAGYGVALLSALTWASYSVLSRLFTGVPSSAVTLYCAVTALGGLGAHIALETSVWPLSPTQWLALGGLGAGPVGLAFYVWDYGCKHGDLRVLGASAYFAPLLSTVLLVALGLAEGGTALWLAAASITGGALLASKDMLTGKTRVEGSAPIEKKAKA